MKKSQQHNQDKLTHNGLPVHAKAQTDNPLFASCRTPQQTAKQALRLFTQCLSAYYSNEIADLSVWVDDLLLLAVGNPEDVPSLQVDDDRGISVAFVERKFVNAKEPGLLLWLYEFPVTGVAVFQPLQINLLDDILAQASNSGNLLVGEGIERQQVTGILVELLGHPVAIGLEGDVLTFCCPTVRAAKLVVRHSQGTQISRKCK